MRALRGIEAAMYTQWKAALTLLDQQWGKWHVSEKGTVLFDDKKAAADYSAIAKQVHTLIQRQQAAEQAVFQPK